MDADVSVFVGDPGSDLAAFSQVRYTIRAGKIIFQGRPAPDRN
jgi:imidazolonepropionase-like amidohydrolase